MTAPLTLADAVALVALLVSVIAVVSIAGVAVAVTLIESQTDLIVAVCAT